MCCFYFLCQVSSSELICRVLRWVVWTLCPWRTSQRYIIYFTAINNNMAETGLYSDNDGSTNCLRTLKLYVITDIGKVWSFVSDNSFCTPQNYDMTIVRKKYIACSLVFENVITIDTRLSYYLWRQFIILLTYFIWNIVFNTTNTIITKLSVCVIVPYIFNFWV